MNPPLLRLTVALTLRLTVAFHPLAFVVYYRLTPAPNQRILRKEKRGAVVAPSEYLSPPRSPFRALPTVDAGRDHRGLGTWYHLGSSVGGPFWIRRARCAIFAHRSSRTLRSGGARLFWRDRVCLRRRQDADTHSGSLEKAVYRLRLRPMLHRRRGRSPANGPRGYERVVRWRTRQVALGIREPLF